MRYFLLAFLLTVSALSAFAESVTAKKSYAAGGGPSFPSPGEACGSVGATYEDASGYLYSGVWYMGMCKKNGTAVTQISMSQSCEGIGGNLVGTFPNKMCECPPGTKPSGGQCVVPDKCENVSGMYHNGGDPMSVRLPGGNAGSDRNYYSGTGSNIPGTLCIDGCQASADSTKDFGVMVGNQWSIAANPKFTGTSCKDGGTVSDTSKQVQKNTPEYDCLKAGKGYGYVNGTVTCTDSANKQGSASKSTTTTNADGTKTTIDKTSVISCTGAGSCTTTTTTTTTVTNSSGQTVGTPTTTTDSVQSGVGTGSSGGAAQGSSFCAENPSSPMCKSGSFVGSCDAQPACEGDPVQCAVAIATWKTECKTMKPGTPPESTPPLTEKTVGNAFSATDLSSGGGICPNPRVITISGHSIHIEFTAVCEFAAGIRPVVILLGWICAGYIVLGRSGGARNG